MNQLLDRIWTSIMNLIQWIFALVQQAWSSTTQGAAITMDTGRTVRLGDKIAEGGFSFVFTASDDEDPKRKYALKQIRCPEPQMLQDCRQEAAVHRACMDHPNCLPLLGFAVTQQDEGNVCYMLFPLMHRSLRAEINFRILEAPGDVYNVSRPPWNEVDVLQVFLGMARGVQALHDAHYTHRDVKPENVLFEYSNSTRTPVLMDFGSAGPLREDITTRRQVLNVVDQAAQHTTMPYRPPELLEGGVRPGDPPLDFTKVDVFSLGCTYFACLYGASPSESEFARQNGRLRIVDCTQLKILGGIPQLPPHCAAESWYSQDTLQLLQQMLTQDRHKRPTVRHVMTQLETLIERKGGRVAEVERNHHHAMELVGGDDDDDNDGFHSLLSSDARRGYP